MPRKIAPVLATLAVAAFLGAHAAGMAQLKNFLEATHTLTADFQQTVTQANGKHQDSAGTMAIMRPGRFDWRYSKPYVQRLVGDGTQVWSYDPDLNQVTVKHQDRALGDSPAALLAGSNELDKRYELADVASTDGLEWVDAKPRNHDSGFEHVRIGFKDGKLAAMDLQDSFGQKTHIAFGNVAKNPKIGVGAFTFTPPKGADVVSAD
ncbi:MAG: outer membrane lipoprotein chaperone LolA [Burkholderiales bacterium]|nr:outer membrane lipoprotein chaperone LolA [Burkholderiales bacterium]